MRVLAIGDIHGCTVALDTLLAQVRPRPEDLIVTLGDYVDRGPDSRGAIERVMRLRENYRVKCLRGNHELMMTAARRDGDHLREWLACGGRETLISYGSREHPATLADVPEYHWNFLDMECLDWFETQTHFFVHANAYADMPLADQPSYMLHWESLHERPLPHCSGKMMVCGHTSQRSGRPLDFGHAVCIDTWVYGDGWLTCLDVENRLYWQANQKGQSRMANLDRFSRR